MDIILERRENELINKKEFLDCLFKLEINNNNSKKRKWNTEINNNICLYWNNVLWEIIIQDPCIISDMIDEEEFIKYASLYYDNKISSKIFNKIIEIINNYYIKRYDKKYIYITSLNLKSFGIFLELIKDEDYLKIIDSIKIRERIVREKSIINYQPMGDLRDRKSRDKLDCEINILEKRTEIEDNNICDMSELEDKDRKRSNICLVCVDIPVLCFKSVAILICFSFIIGSIVFSVYIMTEQI